VVGGVVDLLLCDTSCAIDRCPAWQKVGFQDVVKQIRGKTGRALQWKHKAASISQNSRLEAESIALDGADDDQGKGNG
jgi:hypothetical protein